MMTAVDDARWRHHLAPHEAAVNRTLAELVQTLRAEAGITQTQLARLIGSTQSAVSRMESGANTPTLALLDRLSRALGAPLLLHIAGHAVVFGGSAADTVPSQRLESS